MRPQPPPRTAVADQARPRALPELGLVVVLFLAYKIARLLIQGDVPVAFDNAWAVWDLQRALHLPSELTLQQAALDHQPLVRAANVYYAYVHFPATAAFLLWMYLRRAAQYRRARNSVAALTAAALVAHILMPLAPPRMLTATGMVDTGRLFGPSVYGDVTTDSLTNQFAAMPSLHVGWALAVAWGLIAATRGRWRWAGLLHPAVTVAVVVVTGNHYWLDAIVAAALFGAVLLLLTSAERTGGRYRMVSPASTPTVTPARQPA